MKRIRVTRHWAKICPWRMFKVLDLSVNNQSRIFSWVNSPVYFSRVQNRVLVQIGVTGADLGPIKAPLRLGNAVYLPCPRVLGMSWVGVRDMDSDSCQMCQP